MSDETYNPDMEPSNNADKTRGRPFESGNPGGPGKPKGKTFATLAREAMEACSSPEEFAQQVVILIAIAKHGASDKDRIAAIKLSWEWAGVMAPTKIDARVNGPMSEDELEAILEERRAAWKAKKDLSAAGRGRIESEKRFVGGGEGQN
jgi:hypothetical protein